MQDPRNIPGIDIDTSLVQTNIVRFRVSTLTASELVERCHEMGLYMLPGGADQIRAQNERDDKDDDQP